jgi:hypothetical protein
MSERNQWGEKNEIYKSKGKLASACDGKFSSNYAAIVAVRHSFDACYLLALAIVYVFFKLSHWNLI